LARQPAPVLSAREFFIAVLCFHRHSRFVPAKIEKLRSWLAPGWRCNTPESGDWTLNSSTPALLDFLFLSFVFIDISGSFVQIHLSATNFQLSAGFLPSCLWKGAGEAIPLLPDEGSGVVDWQVGAPTLQAHFRIWILPLKRGTTYCPLSAKGGGVRQQAVTILVKESSLHYEASIRRAVFQAILASGGHAG